MATRKLIEIQSFLTVFVFFLLFNSVEYVLETGRNVLQERMEEEIRVSVLGPGPSDLETWEFMSKEQILDLLKNDEFLTKFSSVRQEATDKYKRYFVAISAVQILLMLLFAFVCSKVVIGIVRRGGQP
jgi:hypothetical protein